MTEHEMLTALRRRFPTNEYVLIPQVRNGTGYQRRTRTADAIGVSLWPSRGIHVHGFEFKDKRSDWLRELKQPEKAEEIGRFCSFWWIVASSPDIVDPTELPSGWGLIAVGDDRSAVVRKASERAAQEPTWSFTAAVLKAASEHVTVEAEVEARIRKAVKNALDANEVHVQDRIRNAVSRAGTDYLVLRNDVDEFRKASGIDLDNYAARVNAKQYGEAVRLLAGMMNGCHGLEGLANTLDANAREIRKLLDALKSSLS